MPDAHDHDLVIFDRVENDILPKATDRQHSHIRTIFQVPHCRVFADTADGTIYLSDDSFSCTWIMPGNWIGKSKSTSGGYRLAVSKRSNPAKVGRDTPFVSLR